MNDSGGVSLPNLKRVELLLSDQDFRNSFRKRLW